MAETVLAKMAVQIAANTAEFNKAISRSESNFKNFTNNISKIGAAVGIAFGVQQVASFAFEVSKLAGEAEGVSRAFQRLPNATRVLEEMKQATGGTVSELELMKNAIQANNFQIPIENLASLFKFATLRAQQTGQSVDYLVQSIILGIGRKSPLILDNLGISAIRLREKLKGVSAEAATVGDVAKVVGDIATEELGNMADFSDNASTKVQRLAASWENYKVKLGEAANGTGVLGTAVKALTDLLDGLAGKNEEAFSFGGLEALGIYNDSIDRSRQVTLGFTEEAAKSFRKFQSDFASAYKTVTDAQEAYINNQYKEILNLQVQREGNEKLIAAFGDETGEIKKLNDEIDLNVANRRKLINEVKAYVATLITSEEANKKQVTTLETLREKQKQLTEQFDNTDEADRKKLSNIGNEIIKTQALIEELEKYRKKQKEVNDLRKVDPIQNVGGLLKIAQAFNKVQDEAKRAAEEIGRFFLTLNPVSQLPEKLLPTEAMRKAFEEAKKVVKEGTEGIQKQLIDVTPLISNGIAGIADALGNALGSGNFKNFGRGLLEAVASFAQQLGALMIASGIAQQVLKSGNPVAMVVAGAALVAAGAAIKGVLSRQSKLPNASTGGGGSESYSGSRSTGVSNAEVGRPIYNIAGVVRGEDLYIVLKNYEKGKLNG